MLIFGIGLNFDYIYGNFIGYYIYIEILLFCWLGDKVCLLFLVF